VWLLNYRNFGDSDHHDSFTLEVSVKYYNSKAMIFNSFWQYNNDD
jgi:hypothetical protein